MVAIAVHAAASAAAFTNAAANGAAAALEKQDSSFAQMLAQTTQENQNVANARAAMSGGFDTPALPQAPRSDSNPAPGVPVKTLTVTVANHIKPATRQGKTTAPAKEKPPRTATASAAAPTAEKDAAPSKQGSEADGKDAVKAAQDGKAGAKSDREPTKTDDSASAKDKNASTASPAAATPVVLAAALPPLTALATSPTADADGDDDLPIPADATGSAKGKASSAKATDKTAAEAQPDSDLLHQAGANPVSPHASAASHGASGTDSKTAAPDKSTKSADNPGNNTSSSVQTTTASATPAQSQPLVTQTASAPRSGSASSTGSAALIAAAAPAGAALGAHTNATVQIAAHDASQPTLQLNTASLALAIAAKWDGGTKHFDISLDPAELGRVDVKLSIDSTGAATAHLTADRPQTLTLMQNDRAALEQGLKNSGLNLAQNGLNFSLRGQQQQNGSSAGPRTRSRALTAIAAPAHNAASVPQQIFRAGQLRLDIRV